MYVGLSLFPYKRADASQPTSQWVSARNTYSLVSVWVSMLLHALSFLSEYYAAEH